MSTITAEFRINHQRLSLMMQRSDQWHAMKYIRDDLTMSFACRMYSIFAMTCLMNDDLFNRFKQGLKVKPWYCEDETYPDFVKASFKWGVQHQYNQEHMNAHFDFWFDQVFHNPFINFKYCEDFGIGAYAKIRGPLYCTVQYSSCYLKGFCLRQGFFLLFIMYHHYYHHHLSIYICIIAIYFKLKYCHCIRLHSKNIEFWNIYAEGEHYQSIVLEQRYIIESSGLIDKLHTVYYTTHGKEGGNFVMNGDKFKHLSYFNDNYEEAKVMHKIHTYCQSNEDDNILYFNTKGSLHNSIIDRNYRRVADCFVLNPRCLDVLVEFDTCGWRLSPLPYLNYVANYWWATCEHINKLIDPQSPEYNQTFIRATASINPHQKHVEDYTFYDDYGIGSGQYFGEAWMGSLPAFKAADCMSTAIDTSSYMGGLALPWSAAITHCPNFNNAKLDLIVKSSFLNGVYIGTNKVKYGSICSTAAIISNPEMMIKKWQDKQTIFEIYRTSKHIKRIIDRTILWYGQPSIMQLEILSDVNAIPDDISNDVSR